MLWRVTTQAIERSLRALRPVTGVHAGPKQHPDNEAATQSCLGETRQQDRNKRTSPDARIDATAHSYMQALHTKTHMHT